MQRLNDKSIRSGICWRSGTGEFLGFAVIIPFLVMVICAVVSVAVITLTEQKMMYTAYSAARAAVVSGSSELAVKRACVVAGLMFPGMETTFAHTGENVPASSYEDSGGCVLQLLAKNPDQSENDWEKGNVLRCTVFKDVDVFLPFVSGVRETSVVMMVENGSRYSINFSAW